MEANNFEKQIQDQLADMSIMPSSGVWDNVAARIDKKKERKFFWLWLLLPLLCIGFYFLRNSTGNLHLSTTSNKIPQPKVDDNNKQPSNYNSNNTAIINNRVDVPPRNIVLLNKNADNNTDNNKNSFKNQKSKKHLIGYRSISTTKIFIATPNPNNTSHLQEVSLRTAIIPLDANNYLINNFSSFIPSLLPDSLKVEVALQNEKIPTPSTNPKDTIHKRTWTFGAQLSLGLSSLHNFSSGNLYNVAVANSNGNPNSYTLPPQINSSTGYSVGLTIQKEINPKTQFVTGINLKHYSVSIRIGISDSSNYYLGSRTGSLYKENFNFIEVPLLIRRQISSYKKHLLYFEGGVNIAYLFNTNGVQYNRTTDRFYFDNSLFRKDFIEFQTALKFQINHSKFPLSVGPSFSYGLSNIANTGYYGKTHFIYVGIAASILFLNK